MNTFFYQLKKDLKENLFDYLILITSGVIYLLFLNLLKGESWPQFIITFLFVGLYILWGFHHHGKKNHLFLKNVLEYILIGFISLFLLKIIFNI